VAGVAQPASKPNSAQAGIKINRQKEQALIGSPIHHDK
jgi:hypothetical protein